MLNVTPGYTFDDVLLVPKFSDIKSRSEIDTSVNLGKGVELKIPIISANMKNVTGAAMASRIALLGGLGILHRFYDSEQEQLEAYSKTIELLHAFTPLWPEKSYEFVNRVGFSVGVNSNDLIDKFIRYGEELFHRKSLFPKVICVDVAHGDSKACCETTEYIAKKYPNVLLIAGNVATYSGAERLYNHGANVVKCGIGGGSLCSTRIETGNGVPQLSALEEIYSEAKGRFKIIADGGLRNGGDVTKALIFSDCVMIGNLLAGTDEAPGDVITVKEQKFKQYAGSSTHKSSHIEGVVGLVPYKGPVKDVIQKLMEGVRSGMSYQGAHNLEELRKNPQFVSISNAGLIESKPHDVLVR